MSDIDRNDHTSVGDFLPDKLGIEVFLLRRVSNFGRDDTVFRETQLRRRPISGVTKVLFYGLMSVHGSSSLLRLRSDARQCVVCQSLRRIAMRRYIFQKYFQLFVSF